MEIVATLAPGSPFSHAPHPLCGDDPKLPRRAAKKERSRRSDIRKINQKCRTEVSLFDRRQQSRGEERRGQKIPSRVFQAFFQTEK